MKRWLLLTLLGFGACTPSDVEYCQRHGEREGTREFGQCIRYFHEQNNAFQRDRTLCEERASVTYPEALYDQGRYSRATVLDPRGGVRDVDIRLDPDYSHNSYVDSLRMTIIQPCMIEKGWNSPNSWELGRAAPSPLPRR